MDEFDQTNHAAEMTTRRLEQRCAKSAAKAGKLLTSAYAILEADLPYFLELRQRLNAQGQRVRDIEGWQRWCEKHFSCSVRTVNRALAAILGPEKERKKSRNWRAPAEALLEAVDPAIRLARKHADKDPDAAEFLSRLELEELAGLVPEPMSRSGSLLDTLNKERRVKKDELYKMGLHLARVVIEGASGVNRDTPDGKRIIGIAKHMLEIKKTTGNVTLYQQEAQDKMSRTPGSNFIVDDDDPKPPQPEISRYYLVHVGVEDGKPIIAKYLGAVGKEHQFTHRAVGTYNVSDIAKVIRPADEKEVAEELAWEAMSKKAVEAARQNQSTARKASGLM